MYSVKYTMYSAQCTVYIVKYTVYIVQCTVYSYSMQCAVCRGAVDIISFPNGSMQSDWPYFLYQPINQATEIE